jgi:hypothetical protein
MGHELGYVYDILNGKPPTYFTSGVSNAFGYVGITIPLSETNAMYWENILRAQGGLPLRQYYYYSSNPNVNWTNGNAIINYDSKTNKPSSIADLDGHTYIIKN